MSFTANSDIRHEDTGCDVQYHATVCRRYSAGDDRALPFKNGLYDCYIDDEVAELRALLNRSSSICCGLQLRDLVSMECLHQASRNNSSKSCKFEFFWGCEDMEATSPRK